MKKEALKTRRHNAVCTALIESEATKDYIPVCKPPKSGMIYYTALLYDYPGGCVIVLHQPGKGMLSTTKLTRDEYCQLPYACMVYGILEMIRQQEWMTVYNNKVPLPDNGLTSSLTRTDLIEEDKSPFMEDIAKALGSGLFRYMKKSEEERLKNRQIIFGAFTKQMRVIEIQLAWDAGYWGEKKELQVQYAEVEDYPAIKDGQYNSWKRDVPYLAVEDMDYKPYIPYLTEDTEDWADYRLLYTVEPEGAPNPGAHHLGLVLPDKREVWWLCNRAYRPFEDLEKTVSTIDLDTFKGPNRRVEAYQVLFLIVLQELHKTRNPKYELSDSMCGSDKRIVKDIDSDDAFFSEIRMAVEDSIYTSRQYLSHGTEKENICEIQLTWNRKEKKGVIHSINIVPADVTGELCSSISSEDKYRHEKSKSHR